MWARDSSKYILHYISSVQAVHVRDLVDGHAAGGVAAVCQVAAGGAQYYHQRDRRGICIQVQCVYWRGVAN